jgi:hypothetical protein
MVTQWLAIKFYRAGVEPDVDAALEGLGQAIADDESAPWWRVADLLFEADLPIEAALAQLRAVPPYLPDERLLPEMDL